MNSKEIDNGIIAQRSQAMKSDCVTTFRTRGYQLEMLERSLKGNVIIAMDTGSGKTEIAVLRIRAELDRCDSEKRIWFLAPTVALCEQQHRYIQARLPETSPLLLVGSTNLDYWSEQSMWDTALFNHRIVISTHAVLLGAMQHGFVRLASLALLVFDEAHHCHKKHAANVIMQQFYHSEKEEKGICGVPHILGLSASPMRGSNTEEINKIERNLDAICVTPRIYRQELLSQVHRPEFTEPTFSQVSRPVQPGCALSILRSLQQKVVSDVESCLQELTHQNGPVISPKSFEHTEKDQLTRTVKQYRSKAEHVHEELGPWATDYFIQKTNALLSESNRTLMTNVSRHEEILDKILAGHFKQSISGFTDTSPPVDGPDSLSDKLAKLIDLVARQGVDTTGVIFVKERVIVSMLFYVLSMHPRTASRFTFATFVGLSSNAKKRIGIHELLDTKSQNQSLEAFHAKQKQIIIATDVLEEGIDVAACNLVICFDPPSNLKSFIQRRGRARMQQSRFVIMRPCDTKNGKIALYAQLEEEMIRMCQDEERERQEILAMEEEDESSDLFLRVKSTGAFLDAAAIKAHLHHFCNTLPKQPFVDTSPYFSIEEGSRSINNRLLTAGVILPNCVGSLPRSYSTEKGYRTERGALLAVAYECYRYLCEADLINENLLPRDFPLQERYKNLDSLIVVDEHIQPWRLMASAWSSNKLYKTTIHVEMNHQDAISAFTIALITPVPIPTTCWSTSKEEANIVSIRIGCSVSVKAGTYAKTLRRHKQKMAVSFPTIGSHVQDMEEPDFVYIFDLDEGRDYLSCHQTIDVGEVMAQIVHLAEKTMIADQLQSSLLRTRAFRDSTKIVEALTAPSANAATNFERLEFLGDAVLKMVVTAQVFTEHANWPAGWLSRYRDTFISNGSLANAAFSLHLYRYIMTKAPGTRTLLLPLISDLSIPPERRQLSSKTLADVIQALIAAAYLDSGFSLARTVVKVFIPEIRSESPTFQIPRGADFSIHVVKEMQSLIGYQFRNITVLLQALTHPSCASHGSEESYQRLAFLGDAVLGYAVSKALFLHGSRLSEGKMTKIKAALVNSNMLGYICMTHSIVRKSGHIEAVAPTSFRHTIRNEAMPLWRYMRHESRELSEAQDACNARYHRLHAKLLQQLQADLSYPWLLLAELRPEGFYSDLIQSVLGAIYVDSKENWDACQRFLDTLGISSYLQQMVQNDYDVTHPRSALQNLAPLAKVQDLHSSDGSFGCKVMVNEVEVASAESCKSRNEASILASHRAIHYLCQQNREVTS